MATTRWDVGSILGVVARIAGPDLLDRILTRLPSGYAILFAAQNSPRQPDLQRSHQEASPGRRRGTVYPGRCGLRR